MDPVDVLTMAVTAAQAIRSAADPEATLVGGYDVLGRDPPMDQDDALAVRIARLINEAGDQRREVLGYLGSRAGPLWMNRPDRRATEGVPRFEPDPEALRLQELVSPPEGEAKGHEMFPDGFGSFSVAERKVFKHYLGPRFVERGGKRLAQREAGEPQPGDVLTDPETLPLTVRGLIDYPLDVPVLFIIETGNDEAWDLWDICCAFADQYERIYEQAERYGVWGHDITDLWIERLDYFPELRLIVPWISS